MEHYDTIVMLALIGLALAIYLIDRHDIKKLLNRIMAKDYKEFQYFEHKYPNDVKAVEDIRKFENKKLQHVMETMKKEKEEEQASHLEDDDVWDNAEEDMYATKFAPGSKEVPGKPVSLED